jgi:hypothetical protein
MALQDITKIPAPRTPIADETSGEVTNAWYRFFYTIYTLSGSGGDGGIAVNRGGTGQTSYTDGQLLIGNSVGNTLSKNTLTPGQNIGITNGNGTIAVAFNGILPVVNGGTGANNATGARANLVAAKSGANADITSMSGLTGPIQTPTYVDFNTAASVAHQLGRVNWNSTDQTLEIDQEYGVVQQVGQETYARVQNNTGVTIPNGTVVGFAGATANALLVSPYLADGATSSLYILGIMTHDLANGAKGYCTTWGFVRTLDTSAFAVGDVLYASPTVAGGLTKVKPTAPNNVIPVAACVVSSATVGVIFVRPTITQMQYYGVFALDTDYSPAVADTAYPIVFDVTRDGNGVVLGTPASRIVVPQAGRYQFAATLQFISSSAADKNIWVWFRKNGVDIPDSARIVTVSLNNAYTPLSITEPVSLAANGYVEIVFAASSTNVRLDAVPATAFAPVSPAVVLDVTQVQQ